MGYKIKYNAVPYKYALNKYKGGKFVGRKIINIVLMVLAVVTVPATVYIMHMSRSPVLSAVPDTNDNNHMWVWGIIIAVCIVAAIVLAVVQWKSKKKK